MSTLGALSQAWTSAEAALPLGWRIEMLVLIDDDRWEAVAADARGRQFANSAGHGQRPYQALNDLAVQLRRLRGPTTG